MSAFDHHRVSKDSQVRLAVGRPAYFMIVEADRETFDPMKVHRIVLGRCKRVEMRLGAQDLDMTFRLAEHPEKLTSKVKYICSNGESVGLVIERIRGQSCLVAMFVTRAAFEEATEAFEEIDEEDEEVERPAYSTRERDTGEEYLMFDPPGGTFRDLGDEYLTHKETGLRLRDRRDGVWKNGDCWIFQPEGEARQALLDTKKENHARLLSVPALERTSLFPDDYEIIEEGSEDGWLVWQWCAENATGDWWWVNLGADGGPWLELKSGHDFIAVLKALPSLFELNPDLGMALLEGVKP